MEENKTFIRYIYCYRDRTTGRALYVGSSWDVKDRNSQHQKSKGPFDRHIAANGGLELFVLEIIDSATELTRIAALSAAALKENFWMNELKTWHKMGGFNFQMAFAEFDSEARYQASRAAQAAGVRRLSSDPKWQAKNAAALKRLFSSLKWKKKNAAHLAGIRSNPEWQKTNSSHLKNLGLDPKFQKARLEGSRIGAPLGGRISGPVNIRKMSHEDHVWGGLNQPRKAKLRGMAIGGPIGRCKRWNMSRGKPCICGKHPFRK